jgi:hypothetical protein
MKVWVAVALVSLVAVVARQTQMALKLERLMNASTNQLVAMDELRATKLGGVAVEPHARSIENDYLTDGLGARN